MKWNTKYHGFSKSNSKFGLSYANNKHLTYLHKEQVYSLGDCIYSRPECGSAHGSGFLRSRRISENKNLHQHCLQYAL